ncbi:MAG: endonuclease III domain-containing protein [Euryarchaeota archaeon]|nr:endonuclease III domain-containing protein [Euryarchaeota archaeon]
MEIIDVYRALYGRYGPQGWWPGETPFEVVVGAILTQNTNWKNVERAIANLKKEGLMTPRALHDVPRQALAELIRPAGYFNVKAGRLKDFLNVLFRDYSGELDHLFSLPRDTLREVLLGIRGIGPETADSIILYAAGKPVFVVDAYTRRIFSRLGFLEGGEDYGEVQAIFEAALEEDVRLFNEYHALIVRHGKEACRPKPLCRGCPLMDGCKGAVP